MSGHASAVLDALERAEARRGAARHEAHFFKPMPDGRCNLCSLGGAAAGHFAQSSLSAAHRHHPFVAATPDTA